MSNFAARLGGNPQSRALPAEVLLPPCRPEAVAAALRAPAPARIEGRASPLEAGRETPTEEDDVGPRLLLPADAKAILIARGPRNARTPRHLLAKWLRCAHAKLHAEATATSNIRVDLHTLTSMRYT